MTVRLSVERLNVTIGARKVLTDVSFEARRGEIVGLVGDSGSGKSMTALALTDLLPHGAHASGLLKLNGTTLAHLFKF